MRILIDTNALIWAMDDPNRLPSTATLELLDLSNELSVGAGSIWELSIKVAKRSLTLSMQFRPWVDAAALYLGFTILPISLDHVEVQAGLPYHHKDPFDRLLIAQVLHEHMGVVSSDQDFDAYGVQRIW